MLKERTEKIEKSLKKAEEIELRAAASEEEKSAFLAKTKIEAKQILKEAKEAGETVRIEMLKESENKVKELFEKSNKAIVSEKAKMMKDFQADISKLISKGLETGIAKESEKFDGMLIGEAFSVVKTVDLISDQSLEDLSEIAKKFSKNIPHKIPEIIETLKKVDYLGDSNVTVTTSRALTAQAKKQITDEIEKAQGVSLDFSFEVDETIIAGIIIKKGENVIDCSAKIASKNYLKNSKMLT